jgi:hypothetical protein
MTMKMSTSGKMLQKLDAEFVAEQFKIVHDRMDEVAQRLEKLITLEESGQKQRQETLKLLNEFMKANALAATVTRHEHRISRIERKLGIVPE